MTISSFSLAQEEADAVKQLQAVLEQTTTLSAEVEQLRIDQDGRELEETHAQLLMQKPASFYWSVTAPYEDLMVTDGTRIWHYEPDLDQVTIQPFDSDLERTPVMLLNGDADSIAASYDVSSNSTGEPGLEHFILLPRQPDSLFERMSLTFRNAVLEEMQFEDSLGQQTSLTFSKVVRNQPVDQSKFSFTPPAGVEIIDNTGN